MASFHSMFIPLLGTLLVCAIGGILSPLVVLKQRSYLGDTLAHLIFPGVVLGMFVSHTFHIEIWICMMIGAFTTAILGTYLSEWFLNTLKIPSDSAAIVCLSAFFALGILLIDWTKSEHIDPENLLFGDVMDLSSSNLLMLVLVFISVLFTAIFYRKHWNAWLTDPEFAKIVGFKIKWCDKLFPILITVSVLAGFFAVGGLMISALITIPAIFCKPKNSVSLNTFLFSILLGVFGFALSFIFGLPVGPIVVLLGFICLVVKSGVLHVR